MGITFDFVLVAILLALVGIGAVLNLAVRTILEWTARRLAARWRARSTADTAHPDTRRHGRPIRPLS